MSTPSQPADEIPLRKNLIFVMPFEEDADTPNRYYKLIYWRFKHIIETKINFLTDVDPKGPRNPNPVRRNGRPCQFNVSVVVTRKDAQLLDVMGPIRDSDIAVGFMTKTDETVVSVTLIYELAVRHLLRSGLVLAIDGDPDELRPRFMRSLTDVVVTPSWMRDESLKRLTEEHTFKPLNDFEPSEADKETLKKLAGLSDANDDHVVKELRAAIQAMMGNEIRQPDDIRRLMRDLDPEFMVSTASVFYPAQITKVSWAERPKDAKGRPSAYSDSDILDLCVCDWNQPFLDLFNRDAREAQQDGILKAEDLAAFLDEYVDPENYQRYLEDQGRLWKLIVLGPQAGVAQVPLIFNSKHPNHAMRNRAFLPCCVLKKRVGNPLQEHYTYLMVIFFDVTDSTSLANPALLGVAVSTAPAAGQTVAAGASGPARSPAGDGKG